MVILDFSLIFFVVDLKFASEAISPKLVGGSAGKVVTISDVCFFS
jgi:hypothetical protein